MNSLSPSGSNVPRSKFLRWLPYLVIAWCLSCMIYGFASFPLTIRHCANDSYCDKYNKIYTEEEFGAFRQWQLITFASWPLGIVSVFVAVRRRRRIQSS